MKFRAQLTSSDGPPARQAATGDPSGTSPAYWRALRILICDDDKDTVDTLAAILEDEGHFVERAYAGLDAVHSVLRSKPGVLICDISMPKVTGFDVVRQIRSKFPILRPLLIAISGVYVKSPDFQLSQALGFDHHLTKPVHSDDVIRLLGPLMGKPQ